MGGNDELTSQVGGGNGEFSFADQAITLARSLTDSIIVDTKVNITASFGLDLTNVFNTDLDITSRLPDPFLRIDNFELAGKIGVKEWSADILITDTPETKVTFGIAEASATINIGALIPSTLAPVMITDASEFKNLFVGPDPKIELSASVAVDFPIFVAVGGVGFAARIGYIDDDLLDGKTESVTIDTDLIFEIIAIQKLAAELAETTKFLDDSDALSSEIPLIGTSLNQLIAGDDRTLADLFDLTTWADNLSPIQNGTQSGFITKTELLIEIRKALQGLFVPKIGTNISQLPPPPDVSIFKQAGLDSSMARADDSLLCFGNDKAISVIIDDDNDPNTFNLTICSLLGFELEASLDAGGLLDLFDEGSIRLELENVGFTLQGSLTIGARISVTNNAGLFTATLQFDPLVVKLAAVASPDAIVGLGLLELNAGIQAIATGEFGFLYCDDEVDVTCKNEGYEKWKDGSNFYFKRNFAYSLKGEATIGAEIPGLEVEEGLTLSVSDNDVFDETAPVVTLPDFD